MVRAQLLLFAIALLACNAALAFGETQTIQFDLKGVFGDGTPYLYSTTNAQIFTESFGLHATYWEPVTNNIPAEVTYKFDFPFSIRTASLSAAINIFFPYDQNAYSNVDVSPDGTNWTNIIAIDFAHQPLNFNGDISTIVAGSDTIFVRDTFTGINYGTFSSSQFLRTHDDDLGPSFSLDVSGPLTPQIYWTDPSGIGFGDDDVKRLNSNGGIQSIGPGLEEPRGIALDLVNQKLYLADLGGRAIRRSNLDGSAFESIAPIHDAAGGVAVDAVLGKVYWTDSENIATPNGEIWRANLDGTDPESLVNGRAHPVGIDVDTLHGKVYWTELQTSFNGHGSIWRADLDGSNVETILTGIDGATGLALDAIHGKLYWPDAPTHRIQSANIDGSGLHDVLTGLDNPTTVDLDLSHGKIYWTSSGGQQANQILRANLDGSDVEIIVSGVGFPWGIAVVPEPSTLGFAGLSFIGLLFSGWRRRAKQTV
jgi:hypothetical protein